jgi:hypothetical protein
MRKFGENPRARKTLIAVLLSCASSFCAFYIYASVVPSSENGNPAENVYKTLINQHSELLIEKGICDEKGREIDGRLGRMIQEARARGMMSDRQVTNCVLE